MDQKIEAAFAEKEKEYAQVDVDLQKCKDNLKEANHTIKDMNKERIAKNETLAQEKRKFNSLKVDYNYLQKK